LLIWKYLSSYVSLAEATTRSQSRRLFFFKYFFVKYFKYLKRKQHHLLTKLTQAIFYNYLIIFTKLMKQRFFYEKQMEVFQ